MSYIGHGLSHAIFGGAVAAYASASNFYLGAGVWGFVSALLINGWLAGARSGRTPRSGSSRRRPSRWGSTIISVTGSFTRNFEAALFGNVLGVTLADVFVVAAVALATAAIVFLRYRALLFATFDPEVAEVSGVHTGATDALMAIILAATITATMNVVGVTLIAAVPGDPAGDRAAADRLVPQDAVDLGGHRRPSLVSSASTSRTSSIGHPAPRS